MFACRHFLWRCRADDFVDVEMRVLFAALLGGFLSAGTTSICSAAAEDSATVSATQSENLKTSGVVGKMEKRAISGQMKKYVLGEVIPMTHDVALLRFLLPTNEDVFNLAPCSTLQAYFKLGQTAMDEVMRFYTPVTPNGTKGYFDIIVKRKPQGRMTSYLLGLHPGDTCMFRSVAFKVKYEPNRWDSIGMIAGGTGFTPMLQVIRHALTHQTKDSSGQKDRTKLSLLFCNRTERHILLKGMFDKLAREYPERFRVAYSVDAPVDPDSWKGYVGYVTKAMVIETMPPPSSDGRSIILICGPDQLLYHAAGVPMTATNALSGGLRMQPVAPDLANLTSVGGILGDLGYDATQVYKF